MDLIQEFLPVIILILLSLGPKILEIFQPKNDEDRSAPPAPDSEEQRRIREEIRRRIEANKQRQQQGAPAQQQQQAAPPPMQQREEPPARKPLTPPPLNSPETVGPIPGMQMRSESARRSAPSQPKYDPYKAQQELADAQKRLESTHQKLEEAKQKARQRKQAKKQKDLWSAAPQLEALTASGLRNTLRKKSEIRRAILLSEVLGKPVAMRDQ